MKSLKIMVWLVLITVTADAQSSADASNSIKPALPDTFQNVLDLAGMTFTTPKDAIPIPVVKNRQMHYEYAITFKDQPFEVRYSVAPLGYTVAEAYTGGKGVTPKKSDKDDDLMSKTMAMAVIFNAAGGAVNPDTKIGYFPPEAVKKEFGADWGGTAVIEIKNNSFGTEYKYGVVTILHKKDVASAYIFYLSDNKENIMNLMTELIAKTGGFYALKFK